MNVTLSLINKYCYTNCSWKLTSPMFQPPSVTVTAFGNRLHKFIPAGEQKDPHSGSLKQVISKL